MLDKVNFFIAGTPKTGTTAIHRYLQDHPKIYLPGQKQMYHFATDHNRHRKKFKKFRKPYYQDYYNYDLSTYHKKYDFNKKYKVYGDITPDYIYSYEAPENIYNYNKEANIIVIIREPLEFLKSYHLQMVNSGNEKEENLRKALALEENRSEKNIKQSKYCPNLFFQYSKLINYKLFIENYYKLFGERIKIMIYEDFKNNNQYYINNILKFCDNSLEPINIENRIKVNLSQKQSPKIKAIKEFYFFRILSSIIPWEWKNKVKYYFERLRGNNQKRGTGLNSYEIELKKKFKQKVKILNNYLNKNKLLIDDKKVDLIAKWNYNNII